MSEREGRGRKRGEGGKGMPLETDNVGFYMIIE